MMKKLIYTLAALLVCVSASAQASFLQKTFTKTTQTKAPTKTQLQKENDELKAALDSLQALIDKLSERREYEEDIAAVFQGNEDENNPEQYSQEVIDSLLHQWYENAYANSTDVEYDMDSVKFTSNVSDEELMRRLKAMNSYISLPFNETVKNYMVLYAEKMPSKMARVIGLSYYYFPIFEETLNKYNLPTELKYMSIIESMLNIRATSRAGARGLWQFMYNTGRNYGLEINSFVDERLDVEKAVDAAARYLADAYSIFGDWALAISSYNCGAGNVSKAIRRAGGARDFWSIYPFLPRETRGYMPAFVGAMYAMTYYREYGIQPMNVGMPAQTDTIEIHRNLHFQQVNQVVGVPLEDLRNLNPQYTHDIIPGDSKTYILNLPFTWTSAFLEADQDSLYKFKADSLMSEKVIKDVKSASTEQRIAYRVKNGDYLGRIASKYGVSVNQIKSWNHLRSNNIRIGQILYIYKGGSGPKTSSSAGSSSTTSGTKNSTASSSSSAKITTGSNGEKIYTVKSGDTLYGIAKSFPGVSADDIKKANHLGSSSIRPGQKLIIP